VAQVRIPPVLRPEAGGNRSVEVSASTVRGALDELVAAYPSLAPRVLVDDGIPTFLNVFVDGDDIRLLDGLETPVGSGATVLLLPAVAGGAGRR
jgi:molybdopterin synthase sulfur carrier subunit